MDYNDPVIRDAIYYRGILESYISGGYDIAQINKYHGYDINDEDYKYGLTVLALLCTQIIDLHSQYGPDPILHVNRVGKFFIAFEDDFLRYIRYALGQGGTLKGLNKDDHKHMDTAIEYLMNMSLRATKYEVVNVINESLGVFFGKIDDSYRKPMKKPNPSGCFTTIAMCIAVIVLSILLIH